jgi:hypothetical protein
MTSEKQGLSREDDAERIAAKMADNLRKGKPPTAGIGRPKGPLQGTVNARAAIGAFIDNNSTRLQTLLDKIEREQGAKAAWDCIMDLVEFHVPKLNRTEVTGKDGGAVMVQAAPTDAAL